MNSKQGRGGRRDSFKKFKKAHLKNQASSYVNMFAKLMSKFMDNKLPAVDINMIDVINKEVKIKFEISFPNYEIHMDNSILDLKNEIKAFYKQSYSLLTKNMLDLVMRIIKVNYNAIEVNKWNEKMFDFKKRKLDSFWRLVFSNDGLMVKRLFQILFLKFQYVSLSQNPSMYACECLVYILKYSRTSSITK